jgi:hypothetical protein
MRESIKHSEAPTEKSK